MIVKALIRPNSYYDSLVLMRAQTQMEALPGVTDAALMMATENNRRIMEATFGPRPEIVSAGPNDLACVVVAQTEHQAQQALDAAFETLTAGRSGMGNAEHVPLSTLESALRLRPDSDLALLSIPGRYVRRESQRAIEAGLNLLIFSDNVPLKDEIYLKAIARERNVLVMGPDCGTAIIGGVALAFANRVRKGRIGMVGASGTGLQEVSCLVDRLGHGVTHVIGTGSRDVSAQVGGATLIQGLRLLDADYETDLIVVISKPPAPEVARKIVDIGQGLSKPTVVCFLGADLEEGRDGRLYFARTLEEAAIRAVAILTGDEESMISQKLHLLEDGGNDVPGVTAAGIRSELAPARRFVRGLYTGGTFACEATLILSQRLDSVHSNLAIGCASLLGDPTQSEGHTCVDLGDDFFTLGRPHPMLEPAARRQRLLAEAGDPETAVILLDVVLGYGVHADPAGELVRSIEEAHEHNHGMWGGPIVVASVCGVEADPQCRSEQVQRLRAAGVLIASSNAAAARLAADIVSNGRENL
jgi:FdrA protein